MNIIPMNNDGNLFDCCYLACLASWMSYKIPFLRKDKDNNINLDTNNIRFINLPVLHLPICITTAYLNGKLLIDPNVS